MALGDSASWAALCAGGSRMIDLLVALADTEDGARSVQKDFEEAGSEDVAGKRAPVNAESHEADLQISRDPANCLAYRAFWNMDVCAGWNERDDSLPDGADCFRLAAGRDGLDY